MTYLQKKVSLKSSSLRYYWRKQIFLCHQAISRYGRLHNKITAFKFSLFWIIAKLGKFFFYKKRVKIKCENVWFIFDELIFATRKFSMFFKTNTIFVKVEFVVNVILAYVSGSSACISFLFPLKLFNFCRFFNLFSFSLVFISKFEKISAGYSFLLFTTAYVYLYLFIFIFLLFTTAYIWLYLFIFLLFTTAYVYLYLFIVIFLLFTTAYV